MEMQALNSSNLESAGYDPETQTLRVRFRKGGEYQYEQFPANLFQGLMDSPSPGQFFADNIKYGFDYQKVG